MLSFSYIFSSLLYMSTYNISSMPSFTAFKPPLVRVLTERQIDTYTHTQKRGEREEGRQTDRDGQRSGDILDSNSGFCIYLFGFLLCPWLDAKCFTYYLVSLKQFWEVDFILIMRYLNTYSFLCRNKINNSHFDSYL